MIDPRVNIIHDRISSIGRIIAVTGGKGGVGKSLLASTLALMLARKGFKTGLFDLDFTSPSTHLILGVKDVQPVEDKGILPPLVHGLKYMSVIYYSGGRATPLRGFDVSNALIELFSVTNWGELDYLIIDTPPGIGDVLLDIIRLIKAADFLVVTTSSKLAFETVSKLIILLNSLNTTIIGIIENMKTDESDYVQQKSREFNVKFLGGVPYDPDVEKNLGNVDGLLKTVFAKNIWEKLEFLTRR
ncbi:MAG: P-loop NTPase [Thermoproteota archaeon]